MNETAWICYVRVALMTNYCQNPSNIDSTHKAVHKCINILLFTQCISKIGLSFLPEVAMNCSKPFPGQADQMFKDKFCKWPKLMRVLVLVSLIPPAALFFMVQNQLVPQAALHEVLTITTGFNLLLLLWGLILKVRSKKYWYRNYHIGKTMVIAMVPVLACGYVLVTNQDMPNMAKQQEAQIVQISVN
ncbi:hypothetical protein MD588_02905 [Photobacterium sp. SDRW27]|uniref:hypothetical protein n=1 Tax=Photobacterium obscurum TaxID=2829490 RepID=UPI002244DE97|nr:hypothetical protein [Photobacterium obscurum]MCW8327744.1 hypothetical protein [Photobacterium obscurum]